MKYIFTTLIIAYSFLLSAQENNNTLNIELNKIKSMQNDTVVEEGNPLLVKDNFLLVELDTNNYEAILGLKEEKDPNIDLLIEDYMEHKKFMGYRIQVFSSNERWEAVKARSEFLKKYPYEKSYLIYQAPNFKVRIGDYEDLLNAHQHIETIKIDFPMAFIIKDEIEPTVESATENN